MELDGLYGEIILDHYRNPRNFRILDEIPEEEVHENPACGDALKIHVSIAADGTVSEILQEARGCAISVASASMMTGLLTGKTREEAGRLVIAFMEKLTGGEALPPEQWGDLASLEGVKSFPLRIKCATLSWHAVMHQFEKDLQVRESL